MSIISDLQGVALASRLLRLSEIIRKDVGFIYESQGLSWEPKWSPVLLILMRRSPLSIQELADELGYTHPSVIALVKEMEAHKFLKSYKDKTDGRRRLIKLTPKALAIKEEMQPICDIMNSVVADITNTKHNLIDALSETEELLSSQSFFDRWKVKHDHKKENNDRI